MTFYFGDILYPYLGALLRALGTSVFITVLSFFIGAVLGIFIYFGRTSRVGALRVVTVGYIEIFRNTPLLVQLYLIYFGLPEIGLNFNPLWATLIGMTLNNSAYTAEIFRSGIDAVPDGLREAGSALGLRFHQIFLHVVLKPAIRNVLPALTNQFIVLFLFSSVGSVISLNELTNLMEQLTSQTNRVLEVFTIGGVMYYLASTIIARASGLAERLLFRW
ncbi:MAG: amino acid ABC transporter permease [Streptosporangiales bacterium]